MKGHEQCAKKITKERRKKKMNKKAKNVAPVHTNVVGSRRGRRPLQVQDSNVGITLIALIITIIVLLILAGVTLNMVMGENGIINKAQLAKEKTNEAQKDEEEQLNNSIGLIDQYLSDNAKITAKMVSFTPDTSETTINYDEDWKKVKNVKEAIDYLYNR